MFFSKLKAWYYVFDWIIQSFPTESKVYLIELCRYRYQVLLSPGSSLNSTSVRMFDTDNPSFTIDDLGETGIYSFAVKLVTSDGYESDVSEVTSFYAPTSKLISLPSYVYSRREI